MSLMMTIYIYIYIYISSICAHDIMKIEHYPTTTPSHIISYSLGDCETVRLRWTDTFSTTCGGPSYAIGTYTCGEDDDGRKTLTQRGPSVNLFSCVDQKPKPLTTDFLQDFVLDAEYGIVLGQDQLVEGEIVTKPEFWYYKVSN